MDQRRVVAFHEMRLVAVAPHQVGQLLATDTGQHRRVGNLEAVEMKDRKDCAVVRRIQKFVRVPAGRQHGRLRLAVADHAGNDQIRIVEGRAVGMGQRIAQFSPSWIEPGSFRRDVARNAVRPGELAKEPKHSAAAAFDRRVVLGIRALQVGLRHDPRAAVTRTDDIHHVQVVVADQPVQVDIQKIQPRRRTPMSQQARLHMFQRKRQFEQRVALQVDLADGEVVRRAPVGVHLAAVRSKRSAEATTRPADFFVVPSRLPPPAWPPGCRTRLPALHTADRGRSRYARDLRREQRCGDPILSVVQTDPSRRRFVAPALLRRQSQVAPLCRPAANHLNPTGTST